MVQYLAGESNDSLFGGNNNWRGPIWINSEILLIYQKLFSFQR